MGYLFEPDQLQQIGQKAMGLPHARMCSVIAEELERAHPGHVETREDWVISIAGGIMGIMTVLHGSLSEYVLLFGTPVGSEGFSGRYRIDIWDVVLAGEMSTYTETDFREPEIHRPGDLAFLRRGVAKGVRLGPGNWLLEYGRGPVPTSLPFALMSAMDGTTIVKTMWVYGKQVVKELLKGKI
jgi:hypothetical protein